MGRPSSCSEKDCVYCSDEGKAEEQKFSTFEIKTLGGGYPKEPDIVQENAATLHCVLRRVSVTVGRFTRGQVTASYLVQGQHLECVGHGRGVIEEVLGDG